MQKRLSLLGLDRHSRDCRSFWDKRQTYVAEAEFLGVRQTGKAFGVLNRRSSQHCPPKRSELSSKTLRNVLQRAQNCPPKRTALSSKALSIVQQRAQQDSAQCQFKNIPHDLGLCTVQLSALSHLFCNIYVCTFL